MEEARNKRMLELFTPGRATMMAGGHNALLIEDQGYPKRCGHFEDKGVVSKNEMVQKIKACVDARQTGMLILARTDARTMEGLDSALDRARADQEAGADLLFVEAPTTLEELPRIPKEVPGRHLYNMVYGGKTPIPSQQALGEMGYGVICYANAALQASMLAMSNVMKHVKLTGTLEGRGMMRSCRLWGGRSLWITRATWRWRRSTRGVSSAGAATTGLACYVCRRLRGKRVPFLLGPGRSRGMV
jgi:hypothetical protein